jgi:hypothetical protein
MRRIVLFREMTPVRIAFRIVCRCASRYAPVMSRAVSLNDAPRESFAGLLDRLTQPAAAGKAVAEDDSVRVSISGRGAAALEAERKRATTPARTSGRRGNRPATEATEISYERALQLLNRHRPPAAQEATGTLPRKPESEQQDAPDKRRSLSDRRNDGPAAKVGEESKSRHRMPDVSADLERAGTVPVASKAHSTASRSSERKTKKNAHSYGFAAGAAPGSVEKPGAKVARNSGRGQHRSQDTLRQDAGKRSSGKRAQRSGTGVLKEIGPESAAGPLNARGQNAMPQPAATPPPAATLPPARATKGDLRPASTPASLEVMRRDSALEQRHAVVSIRVNDMEFDRLRLRAAESGLSVSAYMRSWVLDAEHLRAQVKQALAEMRSSIHLAQAPPSAAPISILNPENNMTSGGLWTRFLWRSATFFLGPLMAFRHRS